MDNNNNHNGKEVPRDQTLRNGQKENGRQPVNRIKKNNMGAEKEVRPGGEAKKIPLNTNRQQGNQKKSTSKGHVIKLEDKENRIHPVDTTPRPNRRMYPKNAPSNSANTTSLTNPPVEENSFRNQANEDIKSTTSAGKYTISNKSSQWLLVAAAIFLIAWAVVFFYYRIGGNSHMLLAFAVICAVISLAGNRKKN